MEIGSSEGKTLVLGVQAYGVRVMSGGQMFYTVSAHLFKSGSITRWW